MMRLLVGPLVLRFSDALVVDSKISQGSCHGHFIAGFVAVNHGIAEGGRGAASSITHLFYPNPYGQDVLVIDAIHPKRRQVLVGKGEK